MRNMKNEALFEPCPRDVLQDSTLLAKGAAKNDPTVEADDQRGCSIRLAPVGYRVQTSLQFPMAGFFFNDLQLLGCSPLTEKKSTPHTSNDIPPLAHC
jgi:hypothetical protein